MSCLLGVHPFIAHLLKWAKWVRTKPTSGPECVIILIVCFCSFVKVLCQGQEILFTVAIRLQRPRSTSRGRDICAHLWVPEQASRAVARCGTLVIAFIRALLPRIFMLVTDDKRDLSSQCFCCCFVIDSSKRLERLFEWPYLYWHLEFWMPL